MKVDPDEAKMMTDVAMLKARLSSMQHDFLLDDYGDNRAAFAFAMFELLCGQFKGISVADYDEWAYFLTHELKKTIDEFRPRG